MNVVSSLESLHALFISDGGMFWRLYSGASTKGKRIGEQLEAIDLESSWALLEERLNIYAQGTFTVVTMKALHTSNARGNSHTVKLGGNPVSSSLGSGGSVSSQLDNLIKLNTFMGAKSDAELAGVYDSAKEDFEKEMKILRLEQQLEMAKQGSRLDRVLEKCLQNLPAILQGFGVQPQGSQLGMLGTLGMDPTTDDNQESENLPVTPRPLDLNALVVLAQRFQAALPDVDTISAITRIVQMAEQSPDVARNFLKK